MVTATFFLYLHNLNCTKMKIRIHNFFFTEPAIDETGLRFRLRKRPFPRTFHRGRQWVLGFCLILAPFLFHSSSVVSGLVWWVSRCSSSATPSQDELFIYLLRIYLFMGKKHKYPQLFFFLFFPNHYPQFKLILLNCRSKS